MEINVEQLKLKQEKRLAKLNSQEVEYAEDYGKVGTAHLDYSKTEYNVSSTNMMVVDGSATLTLTRIIASYFYRVEFACFTKCCDIVQWFEVSDKVFMQCSKRTLV